MSTFEDYGPCHYCGTLTDSGVCSDRCADALDEEKRLAAIKTCPRCGSDLDDEGNCEACLSHDSINAIPESYP